MTSIIVSTIIGAYQANAAELVTPISFQGGSDRTSECRVEVDFGIRGTDSETSSVPPSNVDFFQYQIINESGQGVSGTDRRSVATGDVAGPSAPLRIRDLQEPGLQLFAVLEDRVQDMSGRFTLVELSRVAITPSDLRSIPAFSAGNEGFCDQVADRIEGQVNRAPTANAGPDPMPNLPPPGANPSDFAVILDAGASSDPDGDMLTYNWSSSAANSRDRQFSFPDPADRSRILVQPPETTARNITFTVRVDDGRGGVDTDDITIRWQDAVNRPPVADAGVDQTVGARFPADSANPVTTLLDGSGSTDPDGPADIPSNVDETFTWRQVSGPSSRLIETAITSSNVKAEQPAMPGVAVYEVTVRDRSGLTSTDQVSVTWEANEPATTDAPRDQSPAGTVARGDVITLTAGNITDPEGDVVSFRWRRAPGSPFTQLDDVFSAMPSFTVEEEGLYIFNLELDDGTSTTIIPVRVNVEINSGPVADAGEDQIVVSPNSRNMGRVGLFLDGSGSSDPDNDSLTYQWTQVSGPTTTIEQGFNTSPRATAFYDLPGDVSDEVFVFELIVNDGFVDSAPDRVQYTLSTDALPQAVVISPDGVLNPGDRVTFDGSQSSDPDGAVTYVWNVAGRDDITLSSTTGPTTSFTAPQGVGLFEVRVRLTVTDSAGQSVQAVGSVQIQGNSAPTALATASADGVNPSDIIRVSRGALVILDGSGSTDPEGDMLSYRWEQTEGPTVALSDTTAVMPTFTTPDVQDDERITFSLIVNDGNQDSVAPSTVSITVLANAQPIAVPAASALLVTSGEEVTLDGTGSSDPDGDNLTYLWTVFGQNQVELSDPESATPTFIAPEVTEETVLRFSLVVSDGSLRSQPVFLEITVSPLGAVTIVQTTQGQNGEFTFTSDTSELNQTITTQNGRGEFTVQLTAGTYSVTAAHTSAQGFGLTALSCTDPDATTDLGARRATISLQSGEDITCTFLSVNSRDTAQRAIAQALVQRNALILANQPNASRRLDRLNGVAAQSGNIQLAGLSVLSGSNMPLTASWSDQGAYMASSLAQASRGSAKSGIGSVDVWGEAIFANFDSLGKDGKFSLYYLGADYVVNENLLVGGLVQLDSFKSESEQQIGDMDGEGFMVGPYATAKIGKKLYFDGRLAWGKSDNSISPLGTFVDDFDTDRFLASASVTGDFSAGAKLKFRPTVALRNLSETQNSYTDSLGVEIPKQKISTGEASFSPRVETQIDLNNGWVMRPFGSVEGIVSFGDEIDTIFENDFRARFEGGASLRSNKGVNAGISVFIDGVGSDGFSSEGIRLTFGYTMK